MAFADYGSMLVTVSAVDRTAKLFAVESLDMLGLVKLPDVRIGRAAVWMREEDGAGYMCAVSHADQPRISVFQVDGEIAKQTVTVELPHVAPVVLMQYNARYKAVISVDEKGVIECWRLVRSEHGALEPDGNIDGLHFELKAEPDLFEFAKEALTSTSLCICEHG
jgi:peptidylprolyl isomerase domain and WD repeat-containing protein 1